MMSTADVVRLLAVISTLDNRKVEDSTIALWSAVFEGVHVTFDQCRRAVIRHARESPDYLQPAHVVRLARIERDADEREERRQRALLPREAPKGDPKPADFDAIFERALEEARAARQQGID